MADRDNEVTKLCFSIFGDKGQVGDVTLSGGRCVFTYVFFISGRAWPTLLELSELFAWKLLLPVWWATENCEKQFRWSLGCFFRKFGVPYRMYTAASWAKLADEGRCGPLPTTKFEPLPVGSDWVISVWTWRFSVFRISGVLGNTFFFKMAW